MQISSLFVHTLQTLKNRTAMSSLGLISTSGEIVLSKQEKAKGLEFPFAGNPEQVYNCEHMYCKICHE